MNERIFARQSIDNPVSELASRELARRNLIDFVTYTHPKYIPEDFHQDVARHLELCLNGELKRLIIAAPPQHGKSELVSVRFPAYWLAKRPNDPIILCSYGALLAAAKAGGVKELMDSPLYSNLFPEQFETRGRVVPRKVRKPYIGRVTWAGVGGPITGFGGALGIIDDPVKNYEEAQSTGMREKTWKWWQGVFRTRIWENGVIVIVMTRWHEDDLVGRIIEHSSENWTVLRYPAIAENQEDRDYKNRKYYFLKKGMEDPLARKEGEPLCPKRYSLKELLTLKHDVGSQAWESEYQGAPISIEGNRVKREWLQLIQETPRFLPYRVRYWDKGGTQGGGTYTTGVLMGCSTDKEFFVEHVIRGQWSHLERERIIKDTAILDQEMYGTVETWVEQEPGSGGLESAERTVANLAGLIIRSDKVQKSKDIRFETFAVQCETKNVKIKKAKWTLDYIEEICSVPGSKYRDQADSTSGAFNKIAARFLKPSKTYHGTVER